MNFIIALCIYQSVMALCLWHANGQKKFAGGPGLWLLIFLFTPLSLAGLLMPEFPPSWDMDPQLIAPALRYLVLMSLLLVCLSVIRHRWSSMEGLRQKPAAPSFLRHGPQEEDAGDGQAAGPTESTASMEEAVEPVRKYTILPVQQQKNAVDRLQKIMAEKKVYTDPDLTLEKLAAMSGISRHHISEALNQYEQKSFYQFINEFRIAAVISDLDKCRANGITPNFFQIALSAGFKAKSSFNYYFKSITGCTPSGYLKQPALPSGDPLIEGTPTPAG